MFLFYRIFSNKFLKKKIKKISSGVKLNFEENFVLIFYLPEIKQNSFLNFSLVQNFINKIFFKFIPKNFFWVKLNFSKKLFLFLICLKNHQIFDLTKSWKNLFLVGLLENHWVLFDTIPEKYELQSFCKNIQWLRISWKSFAIKRTHFSLKAQNAITFSKKRKSQGPLRKIVSVRKFWRAKKKTEKC